MTAADTYRGYAHGRGGPGIRHHAAEPSDTATLPFETRLIYVGTGGNLVAVDRDGTEVAYKVGDGAMLPMAVRRILATGTTARDIVVIA